MTDTCEHVCAATGTVGDDGYVCYDVFVCSDDVCEAGAMYGGTDVCDGKVLSVTGDSEAYEKGAVCCYEVSGSYGKWCGECCSECGGCFVCTVESE